MDQYLYSLNKNCHNVSKLPLRDIRKELQNIYNLPVHPQEKYFILQTLNTYLKPQQMQKLYFGAPPSFFPPSPPPGLPFPPPPPGLGPVRRESKPSKKTIVTIITDLGEECDDEVTVFCAILYAQKKDDHYFQIIFTDPEYKKKLEYAGINPEGTYKNVNFIEGNPPNLDFDQAGKKRSESLKLFETDKLLQIGPIHPDNRVLTMFINHMTMENKKKFDYFLLGKLGTTNSPKNSYNIIKQIVDKSKNFYIIDTDRGLGAPQFDYKTLGNILSQAFPQEKKSKRQAKSRKKEDLNYHQLLEHVMNIGFRNTVGRPSYRPVGISLASYPSGANYKTVYNQVKVIKGNNDGVQWADKNEKIKKLADDYAGDSEITDYNNYIEGFGYIVFNLNKYYGVPIKNYISGGPGNWEPLWNYLFYDENPDVDTMVDTNIIVEKNELEEPLNNFKEQAKIGVPLTPAYDCVGLYAVMLKDFKSTFKCTSNRTTLPRKISIRKPSILKKHSDEDDFDIKVPTEDEIIKKDLEQTQKVYKLDTDLSNFNQKINSKVLAEIISTISGVVQSQNTRSTKFFPKIFE